MVAGPVPDETKYTLEPIVRENVEPSAIVSSDRHYAYRDLNGDYIHGYVDHSAKEYVRGEHHTNSIEGHWSLPKRAIKGTHVHVSSEQAWKCVAEFSCRRNMRYSHSAMFNPLFHAFALSRLRES
jgi:hypothetical protein